MATQVDISASSGALNQSTESNDSNLDNLEDLRLPLETCTSVYSPPHAFTAYFFGRPERMVSMTFDSPSEHVSGSQKNDSQSAAIEDRLSDDACSVPDSDNPNRRTNISDAGLSQSSIDQISTSTTKGERKGSTHFSPQHSLTTASSSFQSPYSLSSTPDMMPKGNYHPTSSAKLTYSSDDIHSTSATARYSKDRIYIPPPLYMPNPYEFNLSDSTSDLANDPDSKTSNPYSFVFAKPVPRTSSPSSSTSLVSSSNSIGYKASMHHQVNHMSHNTTNSPFSIQTGSPVPYSSTPEVPNVNVPKYAANWSIPKLPTETMTSYGSWVSPSSSSEADRSSNNPPFQSQQQSEGPKPQQQRMDPPSNRPFAVPSTAPKSVSPGLQQQQSSQSSSTSLSPNNSSLQSQQQFTQLNTKKAASSNSTKAPANGSSRNSKINPSVPLGPKEREEMEERIKVKEFWLSLTEDQRHALIKAERETAMKKMKEQQKSATCPCESCGKRAKAIEQELEMMYDAYYQELERYTEQGGDSAGFDFFATMNMRPTDLLQEAFGGGSSKPRKTSNSSAHIAASSSSSNIVPDANKKAQSSSVSSSTNAPNAPHKRARRGSTSSTASNSSSATSGSGSVAPNNNNMGNATTQSQNNANGSSSTSATVQQSNQKALSGNFIKHTGKSSRGNNDQYLFGLAETLMKNDGKALWDIVGRVAEQKMKKEERLAGAQKHASHIQPLQQQQHNHRQPNIDPFQHQQHQMMTDPQQPAVEVVDHDDEELAAPPGSILTTDRPTNSFSRDAGHHHDIHQQRHSEEEAEGEDLDNSEVANPASSTATTQVYSNNLGKSGVVISPTLYSRGDAPIANSDPSVNAVDPSLEEPIVIETPGAFANRGINQTGTTTTAVVRGPNNTVLGHIIHHTPNRQLPLSFSAPHPSHHNHHQPHLHRHNCYEDCDGEYSEGISVDEDDYNGEEDSEEEDTEYDEEDGEDDLDEDDDEDMDDEYDQEAEDEKIEESKQMLQMFAARMFEQRILAAYREKVTRDQQERLIEEEEERERQEQMKKENKQKKKERQKAKKKQKQLEEEEEKKRREKEAEERMKAAKAEQERLAKEREEKRLEAKRKEEEEKERQLQEAEAKRRAAAERKKAEKLAKQQAKMEELRKMEEQARLERERIAAAEKEKAERLDREKQANLVAAERERQHQQQVALENAAKKKAGMQNQKGGKSTHASGKLPSFPLEPPKEPPSIEKKSAQKDNNKDKNHSKDTNPIPPSNSLSTSNTQHSSNVATSNALNSSNAIPATVTVKKNSLNPIPGSQPKHGQEPSSGASSASTAPAKDTNHQQTTAHRDSLSKPLPADIKKTATAAAPYVPSNIQLQQQVPVQQLSIHTHASSHHHPSQQAPVVSDKTSWPLPGEAPKRSAGFGNHPDESLMLASHTHPHQHHQQHSGHHPHHPHRHHAGHLAQGSFVSGSSGHQSYFNNDTHGNHGMNHSSKMPSPRDSLTKQPSSPGMSLENSNPIMDEPLLLSSNALDRSLNSSSTFSSSSHHLPQKDTSSNNSILRSSFTSALDSSTGLVSSQPLDAWPSNLSMNHLMVDSPSSFGGFSSLGTMWNFSADTSRSTSSLSSSGSSSPYNQKSNKPNGHMSDIWAVPGFDPEEDQVAFKSLLSPFGSNPSSNPSSGFMNSNLASSNNSNAAHNLNSSAPYNHPSVSALQGLLSEDDEVVTGTSYGRHPPSNGNDNGFNRVPSSNFHAQSGTGANTSGVRGVGYPAISSSSNNGSSNIGNSYGNSTINNTVPGSRNSAFPLTQSSQAVGTSLPNPSAPSNWNSYTSFTPSHIPSSAPSFNSDMNVGNNMTGGILYDDFGMMNETPGSNLFWSVPATSNTNNVPPLTSYGAPSSSLFQTHANMQTVNQSMMVGNPKTGANSNAFTSGNITGSGYYPHPYDNKLHS